MGFTSRGGSPHKFTQSINRGLACCDTSQGMVHVAGYVIGGRVMSAERSVQLASQVGK